MTDSMALAPEDRRAGGAPLVDADLRTTWPTAPEPLFAPPWSWFGAMELVRAGQAALERCIGPGADRHSPSWGIGPFVAPIGAEGFTDLIDLDAVEQLLATRPWRDPTFHLVRDGHSLTSSAPFGDDGGPARVRGVGWPACALAELAHGATLVLNDAQDLWPPLRDFCDLLAVAVGDGVTADVHLSITGGPGVRDHVAVDDGFVIQVAGSARWTVEGWALDAGQHLEREWDDLSGGPVSFEAELSPGRCLVVPRGFATTSERDTGPNLAVVICVDGRAVGSTAPGAPDQCFWSGGGGSAAGCGAAFASSAVSVDTVVERRPGVVAWMRVMHERLVLRTREREISGPCWVHEWVVRLLGGPPLSVRDLATPDRAGDALVLVQRLVREGVLAPAKPGP